MITVEVRGKEFRAVAVFLVSVLVVVCFAQTIGYALVWDDVVLLNLVRTLDRDGGPIAILRSEFLIAEQTGYYRPVPLASLWLDTQLTSWLTDPFHLSNILLHLIVSLQVLHFIGLVTGSTPAAVAGAVFFAIHPVHVESVAFVSGRTDLWAALFTLMASVLCWKDFQDASGRPWLLRTVGWGAAGLAVLSKEVAIVLPVVIIASRFWTIREEGTSARRRLLLQFLGCVTAVAAAVAIRYWWAGIPLRSESGTSSDGPPMNGSFSATSVLASVLVYIRLLVIPWPLKAFYTLADVRLNVTAVVAACLLVGLVMVSRFAAIRRGSIMLALVWIGGFLVPVILVPATRWAPLAERFLYIPSVGFALLLGTSVAGLVRWKAAIRPTLIALVVLTATLTALSIFQGRIWQDEETLFNHVVGSSPDAWQGYVNLGIVRQKQGRIEEAIALYRRAIALKPDQAEALNNLGNALLSRFRYDEAIAPLSEAIRLNPKFKEALVSLGAALAAQKRYPEALTMLENAIGVDRGYAEARYNLGLINLILGRKDLAREQHKALLELDPRLAASLWRQFDRAQISVP